MRHGEGTRKRVKEVKDERTMPDGLLDPQEPRVIANRGKDIIVELQSHKDCIRVPDQSVSRTSHTTPLT